MEQYGNQPNTQKTLRGRALGGVILLLGAALGGALLWLGIAYFGLRPIVVWEYGAGIPEIGVFAPNRTAYYVDVLPQKPDIGWHAVRIEADGAERTVWLVVRDTAKPTAKGVERTVSTKAVLQPTELITGLSDADKVWVDYLETPPFGTVGDYAVTVLLEDVSGNRARVESTLHIRVTVDAGVTVEAGADAPTAQDFLLEAYDAALDAPITDAMLHAPGVYPIGVTVDGVRYETTLTVQDTVPPAVQTQTRFIAPGSAVSPEDFCTLIADETATTASFLVAPDPDSREFQQVSIRVTDAAGNYTDATAGLLFTHSTPVVIEARKEPLTADECLEPGTYAGAVLIRSFVPDTPGFYAVSLYVDDVPEYALVEVRDTTPPAVETPAIRWYLDHPLEAAALCIVTDVTETTVAFTSAVDWTSTEMQTVLLLVTDAAGNATAATVELTLRADTQAPVLYGVKTKYFYLGEPFTYLEGVVATDNADGEVPVTVDTSGVDASRVGNYYVTYSAVDAAGNATSKRVLITVKGSFANMEKLQTYVKRVTDRIFTPEMTLAEKVLAVYDYVYTNVRYTSRSDKSDWRKEALRGLMYGKGDCFTSNSVARALLEDTGAEIVSMRRKSYNSSHYWLLINVGTGWYHFDATNSREHGYKCCMWTDAQCAVMGGFWKYDKSTCPAVATERFDKTKAAAVEEEWVRTHQAKDDA